MKHFFASSFELAAWKLSEWVSSFTPLSVNARLPSLTHSDFYFLLVCVSDCCLWLVTAVVVNPACFPSGQFGWRCVWLPHSSSRPRPFFPSLPASQLPLRSSIGCSRGTDHTWRCATPPRLGNGQNGYWPTIFSQVRGLVYVDMFDLFCRFVACFLFSKTRE